MNSNHHNLSVIPPSESHPLILYLPDGTVTRESLLQGVAVFPGSFNPLHVGHLQLAGVAEKRLGVPVVFEVSVSNVEKDRLNESQILSRLQQFREHPVAVTNASRFLDKASLFDGCPFVVGFDTAARLLDTRFYDGSEKLMRKSLRELQLRRHRFLVGGRLADSNGITRFCDGSELPIPDGFDDLFDFVGESEFRVDIRSREIRSKGSKKPLG